jgi:hypothetical protein
MIDQRRLLVLQNVAMDDAALLSRIDDICDAVSAGHAFFSYDNDLATGLFLTRDGYTSLKAGKSTHNH